MGKNKSEVTISTIIGRGTELQGDFNAKGSARIDGKVDGNVTVEGMLVVGAGASIVGNVSASDVLVGGEINGNINVSGKAELTATARVFGDITTTLIVIDERAVFQGKCDMNQTAPDRKSRTATAKAVRAGRKSAKAAIVEALKEVAEEEKREELRSAQSVEKPVAAEVKVENI